jgi:hypothetical protein
MILCEWDAPEGDPGQSCVHLFARILSTSFTSVSIFSVCCYSIVSISMDSPGGEGDGGSIFGKTREIGLPSYNDLSTAGHNGRCPLKRGLSVDPLINGTTVKVCYGPSTDNYNVFYTKILYEQLLTVVYQRIHDRITFNGIECINQRTTSNSFVPPSKDMFCT